MWGQRMILWAKFCPQVYENKFVHPFNWYLHQCNQVKKLSSQLCSDFYTMKIQSTENKTPI